MADDAVRIELKRAPGTKDIPAPQYMSEHASGMDVRAAVVEPLTLDPGGIALVPTGLFMAIPPGYEAQVRARSGLALKNGIIVVNAPGTIDADYRGEVRIILGNFGREPFVIRRGDRIAQLVIAQVARAQWAPCDELSDTRRNAGGFGHTGV